MNTNNIYEAPAGLKSLYLVLWAVTKEEARMVDLSLMGEQRQTCVKNYTHTHLIDRNKD